MSTGTVIIERSATARQIVDALNEWAKQAGYLVNYQEEVKVLWRYLSALRGPDERGSEEGGKQTAWEVKGLTTESLRAPLWYLADIGGGNAHKVIGPIQRDTIIAWLKAQYEQDRAEPFNWHFRAHVAYALRALMHMGFVPPAEVSDDF